MDREDAEKPRDAQQAQDLTLPGDQPDLPALLLRTPLATDQGAEPGRVDEIQIREVDDDRVLTALGRILESGAHRGEVAISKLPLSSKTFVPSAMAWM